MIPYRYTFKAAYQYLTVSALAISAALAATVMPAQAQQARLQQTAAAESGVEEVIVTARKRQESLISVPVVETALPQAKLEAMQTTAVTDLVKLVPGLTVGHATGAIGSLITLRGVGTQAPNPGVESSVSLNLDGMSLGTGLAYQAGLFDLGQIEVLKGPQALFYGKGSPGGVISLRSADPTDKFEVIARVGYEFEARTNREEVILSGPVTDTLKLRLASMYSTSEGYFNETAVAIPNTGALNPPIKRGPNAHDYMVRGTALWNPTDQFDARLKVNFTHDRSLFDFTDQVNDCPQGPNFAPSGIPFLLGVGCQTSRNISIVALNPANFPGMFNNGVPFNELNQQYGTLELNYRPMQDVTITSVTGLFHLRDRGLTNAAASGAAGPPINLNDHFQRRQLTEELRANTDFNKPLNFTLGAYYEDGQFHDKSFLGGNSAYKLPQFLNYFETFVNTKAYSVFGQARYKIIPTLELDAGLRWTDETRNFVPYTALTTPETLIAVLVPRIHSSNVAPEVTLTYRPTDDLTMFAAYRQAYKSGSYNTGVVAAGKDNSFGDEKVQGGELGMKSRWLDRQLALNAAVYYYHYAGLQVGTSQVSATGQIVNNIVNAGSARSYGLDLDAAYRPQSANGLTLNGAVNWNHARYVVANNLPCFGGQTIAMGCDQHLNPVTGLFTAQNFAGQQMIHAPEWAFAVGFDYEFPVAGDYKMTLSNSTSYSSRFPAALYLHRPNNDNYQSAYAKVDLSLALQPSDNRWEISLVGKNINDKIVHAQCGASNLQNGAIFGGEITGGTAVGPAGVDTGVCFVDPGREIWLRVTLRPFG